MNKINVVKIGGNVIDNPEALKRFAHDFAALPSPKILIHGGGKLATRLGEQLNIPAQMIDGRRVTDAATLDIVTMVYAGLTMPMRWMRMPPKPSARRQGSHSTSPISRTSSESTRISMTLRSMHSKSF